MVKELNTPELKWNYKDYIVELSINRLRYKVYNDKNQVVAMGVSYNGKKYTKDDIHAELERNKERRIYENVIC